MKVIKGANEGKMKDLMMHIEENAERIIKVSNIDYAGPALDKLPTETTLKLNIPYDADEDDIYDMVADELEDRHGVKVSGFDMNFAESIEEDTVTEGYEKMVMNACKDAGIDCGFRDGKLIVDKEDMAAAKQACEKADLEVPQMVSEGSGTCPECGCPIGNPKPGCDCAHDVHMDEDMSDEDVDKFHKALDRLVHKHLGHSSDEEEHMDEGKMKDLAMHIEDMINDGASDAEIMAMHPEVSAADIKSMRKDVGDRPGEYDESLERMRAIAGIGSNAKSNHGIREGEAGYQITPRSIVAREMRKLQDLERNN